MKISQTPQYILFEILIFIEKTRILHLQPEYNDEKRLSYIQQKIILKVQKIEYCLLKVPFTINIKIHLSQLHLQNEHIISVFSLMILMKIYFQHIKNK